MDTGREVESRIMENAIESLERGVALIWFTGFVLLGMLAIGGALVPLWVRAGGNAPGATD